MRAPRDTSRPPTGETACSRSPDEPFQFTVVLDPLPVAGRREGPPDPRGSGGGRASEQAHHAGTLVERHVRPLVIAGPAPPVPASAADSSRIRARASLIPRRPPGWQGRRAPPQCPVGLQGGKVAARHRRLLSRAPLRPLPQRRGLPARGPSVQPASTGLAAAKRSRSRPTITTSTARPAARSAAHRPACASPHVRTPLGVTSFAWTNTNVARSAEGHRQLVREVPGAGAPRAPVHPPRQRPLRRARRLQRRGPVRLGRRPRLPEVIGYVVEGQQPPQNHCRRRLAPVPEVLGTQRRDKRPRRHRAWPRRPVPSPLDRRPPADLPPAPRAVPRDEARRRLAVVAADEGQVLLAQEHPLYAGRPGRATRRRGRSSPKPRAPPRGRPGASSPVPPRSSRFGLPGGTR